MIGGCSTHTASVSSAPSSPAAPSQAAADNLGLTSSAVSQHLAALQKETGLDPVPAGRTGHRADRGRPGARRPDRRGDEPVGPARPGRRRPARRPLGPAVDRLLRLGRRRVDAVARQAPDRRVPRHRARARAHRGGAAGARPRHRPRHRPAGPRTGGRLPADRADRGPVRRDRAARRTTWRMPGRSPWPTCAARPGSSNDFPRSHGHRLVVAACSAAGFRPRFSVQAQDHYTAIGFVAAGIGVSVLPGLAARSLPATVVRLGLRGARASASPGRRRARRRGAATRASESGRGAAHRADRPPQRRHPPGRHRLRRPITQSSVGTRLLLRAGRTRVGGQVRRAGRRSRVRPGSASARSPSISVDGRARLGCRGRASQRSRRQALGELDPLDVEVGQQPVEPARQHQARSPSRCMTAGVSVIRTSSASTSTPTASPNPIGRDHRQVREREPEEHRGHDDRGRGDDLGAVPRTRSARPCGSPRRGRGLVHARDEEHLVVHREAEEHADRG